MHKHIIRFVVAYSLYANLHIFVASTHLALELQRHKPAEHPMHNVLLIFLFFLFYLLPHSFFRFVSFESSYSYILVCISLQFFVLAHFFFDFYFLCRSILCFILSSCLLFNQKIFIPQNLCYIIRRNRCCFCVRNKLYAENRTKKNRKQNTH